MHKKKNFGPALNRATLFACLFLFVFVHILWICVFLHMSVLVCCVYVWGFVHLCVCERERPRNRGKKKNCNLGICHLSDLLSLAWNVCIHASYSCTHKFTNPGRICEILDIFGTQHRCVNGDHFSCCVLFRDWPLLRWLSCRDLTQAVEWSQLQSHRVFACMLFSDNMLFLCVCVCLSG